MRAAAGLHCNHSYLGDNATVSHTLGSGCKYIAQAQPIGPPPTHRVAPRSLASGSGSQGCDLSCASYEGSHFSALAGRESEGSFARHSVSRMRLLSLGVDTIGETRFERHYSLVTGP